MSAGLGAHAGNCFARPWSPRRSGRPERGIRAVMPRPGPAIVPRSSSAAVGLRGQAAQGLEQVRHALNHVEDEEFVGVVGQVIDGIIELLAIRALSSSLLSFWAHTYGNRTTRRLIGMEKRPRPSRPSRANSDAMSRSIRVRDGGESRKAA